MKETGNENLMLQSVDLALDYNNLVVDMRSSHYAFFRLSSSTLMLLIAFNYLVAQVLNLVVIANLYQIWLVPLLQVV